MEGPDQGKHLEVFAGSAIQPALERMARVFEQQSGARVALHFGGSGAMLSQMMLAQRGDIYFPGSSDYMEIAKGLDLVDGKSEVSVCYLLPALLVAAGNPRAIHGLEDLQQSGLRLGIARPDTVCVGLYAVEVLERAELGEGVMPNIVTHAESCAKTAQLITLGQVDAVIGWRVFARWAPERVEAVLLAADEVPRIGVVPAAITRTAREPELARAFLEFLGSPPARSILRELGYLTTVEEARALASPTTPVGGTWELPEAWRP